MRRRYFITRLCGSAAAIFLSWPNVARAQQQPDRMRRIGLLEIGNRISITAITALTLLAQPAVGDIVRRATIPSVMLGTWAEAADQCATKDQSNVLIESTKYADGSGSCMVRWVAETPSPRGTNYAVHALCTSAKDQSKTQLVNIIILIRPQGNDQASMGRSFGNLKTHHRCPE